MNNYLVCIYMNRKLQKLRRKSFFYKSPSSYITQCTKESFFFGNSAYQPASLVILTSLFLTRFILFLKKIVRKRDKSQRRYWLAPRSFLRVTLKSKGARMGKGKGKHIVQIQRFRPFVNFVEFLGVRLGRLRLYLFKLNSRMTAKFFLKTPLGREASGRLMFYR
jgi:ribosomal protein L16/L10AE